MADEFNENHWWDKPRFETGEASSVSSSQDHKTTVDPGELHVMGYGFQSPANEWNHSFAGVHRQKLAIDQRPQILSHGNFPAEPPGCYTPSPGSPFYSLTEQQFRPFLSSSSVIKPPPFQFSTGSFLNSNPPTKYAEPTTVHNTRSSSSVTRSGNETSVKRSRSEESSPLPPFKARKEKMGDRITTLQQLVSPFGKTDTASVLSEAIEYIKFLHEQITVMITPYFHRRQHSDKDLQSGGLCLVPVPSSIPVGNETSVEFWSPAFTGMFKYSS